MDLLDFLAAGDVGACRLDPAALPSRKSLRLLRKGVRVDRRKMIPLPVRVERMKKCRYAKALKAQHLRRTSAEASLAPVAEAWNSTQLRFRDHAGTLDGSRAGRPKRLQLKQWTVHGSLKQAFTLVQPSWQYN